METIATVGGVLVLPTPAEMFRNDWRLSPVALRVQGVTRQVALTTLTLALY